MTPHTLVDQMRALSPEQVASFAAACATRTSPIIDAFSGRNHHPDAEAWIGQLWSLVASPDRRRASELAERVGDAPLARVDDSNHPDFYAMRALSVLAYAVQVQLDDDQLSPVLLCSRAAVSLLRDLDFIVGLGPGSPGSLADLEVLTEQAWISYFGDPGSIAMGRKEAMASDIFRRLPEVCTQVARERNWMTGDDEWSGGQA